ncbi:MAG: glycosyltransferase [Elusimicrobiota bacterium]
MTPGKTLLLSHQNSDTPNDVGNGYQREFEKNGALFLDYRVLYLKHGHYGSQKFISNFIREKDIKTIIFAADPISFHFPLAFFAELRSHVFTAMMAGDTVYYFEPRDKYYAGIMDLFIIYDSFETLHAFKKMGGDALMFLSAYDRAKYLKLASREKTIDVSFVGGFLGRKDRAAYVDYLCKNGINVQVFGFGAPGGQVTLGQMVEIFNKSKINLNFTGATALTHLYRTTGMPANSKQLKGRITEVALCGSFALSEYAPNIEQMFLPGEEMAVFSTKAELLDKIQFYLSNSAEREAIADRGYRRAIKDYDISIAIPKLLAEIEARRQKKMPGWPGIHADAIFKKNFASYRMLYIIKFLKRLQFAFALEEFFIILKLRTIDLSQLYTFFVEEVVDKFPATKAFLKKVIFKSND